MDRRSFLRLGREPQDNFELAERESGVVEAKRPELVLPRRDFVKSTAAAALLTGSMFAPGSDAHGAESVERKREVLFEWGDDPAEHRKMRKMFNWVDDDREIQTLMAEAQALRDEDFADPKEFAALLKEYDFLAKDEQLNPVSPREHKQRTLARATEEYAWEDQVLADPQKWLKNKDRVKDKDRTSYRAEHLCFNPPDGFELITPSTIDHSEGKEESYARFGPGGFRPPGHHTDIRPFQFKQTSTGALSNYFVVEKNPRIDHRGFGEKWNGHGVFFSAEHSKDKYTWDEIMDYIIKGSASRYKRADRLASK